MNTGDGPSKGIVNSKFGRSFGPQNAPIVSQMPDECTGRVWVNRCMAHPSIARRFYRSKPHDVGGQINIASNGQVGCWNDGEGFGSSGLKLKRGGDPPAGLMLTNPTNTLFFAEFLVH